MHLFIRLRYLVCCAHWITIWATCTPYMYTVCAVTPGYRVLTCHGFKCHLRQFLTLLPQCLQSEKYIYTCTGMHNKVMCIEHHRAKRKRRHHELPHVTCTCVNNKSMHVAVHFRTQPTFEEECVVCISCRMLLGLEQSIEVPEWTLHKIISGHLTEPAKNIADLLLYSVSWLNAGISTSMSVKQPRNVCTHMKQQYTNAGY